MITQLLLFPLLSSLFLALAGRSIGSIYAGLFAVFSAIGSCLLSAQMVYFSYLYQFSLNIDFGLWFAVDSFDLHWKFFIDSITVIMIFVVTFIACLVHLYSVAYLDDDPSVIRFLSYLSLFTFFMLFYVMAGNFVLMFIGWEGVGLVSYLLINFWYNRFYANRAALKAIIVNRIGDFFFLSAIVLIWAVYGNTDIIYLFNITFLENNHIINFMGINFDLNLLISICLLLAAFVKSAQIGFHTWLADAMEGPTPVSALLHAATMVTAGVFLVIRSSFLLEKTPIILTTMLVVGSVTTFFASFTAFFQYDMKKIIAYSTCAQLGLMFVSCGLGNYILALFHLFNHAFFKALLFLSAGVLIHGANDEQDIRKFGNIWGLFPIVFYAFFIGSLSLMGMPFLTGFYSKELILNMLLTSTRTNTFLALWLALIGTMFTAAYSTRLLDFLFFKQNILPKTKTKHLHESTRPELLTPLFILIVASICAGFIFNDLFLAPNSIFWKNALMNHSLSDELILAESLPALLKQLPFLITIIGVCFYFFYTKFFEVTFITKFLQMYSKMKLDHIKSITDLNYQQAQHRAFFFDHLYYFFIVKPLFKINYNSLYLIFEKGIFEYFGPEGLSRISQIFSKEILLDNEETSYDSIFILDFIIIIWLFVIEFLFM